MLSCTVSKVQGERVSFESGNSAIKPESRAWGCKAWRVWAQEVLDPDAALPPGSTTSW